MTYHPARGLHPFDADAAAAFAGAVDRLIARCRELVDLYDDPTTDAAAFGAAVVAVRNLADIIERASQ